MENKYEALKLSQQLCFPLYACSREMIKLYKPYLDELGLTSEQMTERLTEAYETAAAIDEEDWDHVADELGDVLLQIALHTQIAIEHGDFTIDDVSDWLVYTDRGTIYPTHIYLLED